ncbi:hypothetical protein KGQ27_02040 [Patescibacteria group bacterium]|nr:hypothetical protein [Patescibacteria group bacterium]MDE1946302.1 hypothetical protein [Patescibacteria group bacterium]MDE2010754.1 hypothetical protein [Patescibacteria group bacterium]MDE2232638.1 hypothetical protein [Patescibacteria group bacterium]
MNKNNIIKYALANALWTALYVILIGVFLNNAPLIFGRQPGIVAPIVILLLFVLSAVVCGALFLGKPILWYLEGNKREALSLFGYTLLVFFVVTVLVLISLAIF